MEALLERVRRIPREPGVYLLRGERHEVLYVGKAKSLHARVATYFQARGDSRFRMHALRNEIRDVEVIVTDTEKEALILEHTLIQRHLPRFNVRLKDDKSYLSLRVDPRDAWPRVRLVRRWRKDGAMYFGPYASAGAVRRTLRWIRRHFGLRSCTDAVFRSRTRACLYYQIRECSGPCVGLVSREDYHEALHDVIQVLRGDADGLIGRLRGEMRERSDAHDFERAAVLRDQIQAFEEMLEPQKVDESGGGDRDILAMHRDRDRLQVVVQFVRDGRLVNSRSFPFRSDLGDGEFLSGFVTQFYGSGRLVPPEVLLPEDLDDREVIEEWLAERRGGRVRVARPQRGKKAHALAMAAKTAAAGFQDAVRSMESRERTLERIADALGLRATPRIMECYDISNLAGESATGSLVTFEDGFPMKARYRRYRIGRSETPDDPGMMRELIRRRFERALRDGDFLPHLVILDGGIGQLNAAREVLAELGIDSVDTVALAKGRDRKRDGRSHPGLGERVLAGIPPVEIRLEDGSLERRMLGYIRDEAHRFAVRYHRQLRQKRFLHSPLDDLFGLGEKRRRALIQAFGSVDAIRHASVGEIRAVPGITEALARDIHATLQPKVDGDSDGPESTSGRVRPGDETSGESP